MHDVSTCPSLFVGFGDLLLCCKCPSTIPRHHHRGIRRKESDSQSDLWSKKNNRRRLFLANHSYISYISEFNNWIAIVIHCRDARQQSFHLSGRQPKLVYHIGIYGGLSRRKKTTKRSFFRNARRFDVSESVCLVWWFSIVLQLPEYNTQTPPSWNTTEGIRLTVWSLIEKNNRRLLFLTNHSYISYISEFNRWIENVSSLSWCPSTGRPFER